VTLCHATQGINPWISITIDEQAAFNGHVDPPSDKDDHTNDIIPPFTYKVKGQNVFFPGLNMNTLFGGIPGSVILANDCKVPTVVTPAASASAQTCTGGVTLVAGRIQLTIITGVTYTITGPGGTLAYDPVTGLSDPAAPGSYSVAFTLASGYYTNVQSPILLSVGAYTGPCAPNAVTPGAVGHAQTCFNSALLGGWIQLTVINGVTYTITAPDNSTVSFDAATGESVAIPPGTYSVSFTLDPSVTTNTPSPISVTIDPYVGFCGNIQQVAPGATPSPETCSRLGALQDGSIQLDVIAGVTYVITAPDNSNVAFDAATGLSDPVGPGTYSITFTLDAGLGTAVQQPILVTVDAYAGVCVPPSDVTPGATATDQSCVAFVFLTDGFIQLTVTSGVNYTITDSGNANVPFNLAGLTGPLAPGTYTVSFTTDPGYQSTIQGPILVTIDAYPDKCDLTTFPLVTPQLDTTPMTCTGPGSYTLSNDLSDPAALTWDADGSTVSESTHTVSTPDSFTVTATANAPSYGLTPGAQSSWDLTFERPDNCNSLLTLAMTGNSPIGAILFAGMLLGTGLWMLRARKVTGRFGRPFDLTRTTED
jgi:hypothetical protein